jgi:hypothetical protein
VEQSWTAGENLAPAMSSSLCSSGRGGKGRGGSQRSCKKAASLLTPPPGASSFLASCASTASCAARATAPQYGNHSQNHGNCPLIFFFGNSCAIHCLHRCIANVNF